MINPPTLLVRRRCDIKAELLLQAARNHAASAMLSPGEVGGASEATVTLASAARGLTRPLTLTRSDAEMRRRNPGDAFRRYTDIAGEVGVWWGEKRERA